MHLIPIRDGNIRSAKIEMPSGKVLGRPLNLLFPIETSTSVSDTYSQSVKSNTSNESRPVSRISCSAAESAKAKMRENCPSL